MFWKNDVVEVKFAPKTQQKFTSEIKKTNKIVKCKSSIYLAIMLSVYD